MGIAKLYGQKASGTNINGIIKDYHAYAGENISAGDLVEYINGVSGQTDYGASSPVPINITTEKAGYNGISAVQLDDDRVFITYSYRSSTENLTLALGAVIVTIKGASITVGTHTVLATTAYSGNGAEAMKLDENRVFIAHPTNGSYHLSVMICTIEGSVITPASDTTVATTEYSSSKMSLAKLDDNRIFIAHSHNKDYYYLYGIVITVSGTSITTGTNTAINSSTGGTGSGMSAKLLPNGNIFIAHTYSKTTSSLYAIIVTVSGTTISKATDTQLTGAIYAGNIRTEVLSETSVFVAYSYSTTSKLNGIVCTVSGTSISAGTITEINTTSYAGYGLSTLLLPSGKILIVHSSDSSYCLSAVIVTVSGTTITLGTETLLNSVGYTGYSTSVIFLSNGSIFIAHSYSSSYNLYAQIFGIDEVNNVPTNNIVIPTYEQQVRKTTTSQFDGVAKTSGVGGNETGHKDLVSIYTLEKPIENLIVNGDFSNGVEGWTPSSKVTTTEVDGVLCMTVEGASGVHGVNATLESIIPDHIYYFSAEAKASSGVCNSMYCVIKNGGVNTTTDNIPMDNTWHKVSMLYTGKASSSDLIQLCMYNVPSNGTTYWDNVKLYDLTEYYGAGNEPTQEWCDENL